MSRTYILNLLFLINYMCKVSQFCNVGSHAQQMCHTPSLMDIYTGKVGENMITTTHIFLSHLKEYELPGGRISATRGKDEEDRPYG